MFLHNKNTNLSELRERLVIRVSILLVIGSGVALWVQLIQTTFQSSVFLVLASLLFLTGAVLWQASKTLAFASRCLIWGLAALVIVAMRLSDNPLLPVAGIFVTYIGILIAPLSGSLATGAIAVAAILFSITGFRYYDLTALGLLLFINGGLALLITHTLFVLLGWYQLMHERSAALLAETREHRAEMIRVLKSLEIAVTAERATKRELIHAKHEAERARRLKEQFAANISHEFRTPLNLILGFSEVMYHSPGVYGDFDWTPLLRRDVYQIYRSSRHLLEMINDILDLSKFEMTGFTLNYERTAMADFLRETAEIAQDLFKAQADVPDFQVWLSDNLPSLEIDQTRMRQVILNLLSNARRFTERGFVRLEGFRNHHSFIIRVADSGTGIPADKIAHIFEEFYQADPSLHRQHDGVGLGLTISKRFVEAHGGTIRAESQENRGAIFTIELPAFERDVSIYHPPLNSAVAFEPLSPADEPMRPSLLVIDPDPQMASLFAQQFNAFQVVGLPSDDDIPEPLIERSIAVIRNVPLFNSAETKKSNTVRLPVIDCRLASEIWFTKTWGVSAYLEKPITSATLIEAVNRYQGVCDILVIDDEREFAILIERILQTSGHEYHIRRAYSGEQALEELTRHMPQLILLDLVMPEMNGFQVLSKIRAQPIWSKIPLILLTATSFLEDSATQNNHQMIIHYPDNFQLMEMLRCIGALLSVFKGSHSRT